MVQCQTENSVTIIDGNLWEKCFDDLFHCNLVGNIMQFNVVSSDEMVSYDILQMPTSQGENSTRWQGKDVQQSNKYLYHDDKDR